MYSITVDDISIYNNQYILPEYQIGSPKLSLKDRTAGELEFTLPLTSLAHELVQRMASTVRVFRDKKLIWEGRPISENTDFYDTRVVTCEGALAYLNDTCQPQKEYRSIALNSFVKSVLEEHNNKVSESRRIYCGQITVSGYVDTNPETEDTGIDRYTQFEKTLDVINNIATEYNAHLRIRYVQNQASGEWFKYLDILTDNDLPGITQKIEFGENLLDFTKEFDLSDLCTVLLPLGKITARAGEDNVGDEILFEEKQETNDEGETVTTPATPGTHKWPGYVLVWDGVTTKDDKTFEQIFLCKPKESYYMTSDSKGNKTKHWYASSNAEKIDDNEAKNYVVRLVDITQFLQSYDPEGGDQPDKAVTQADLDAKLCFYYSGRLNNGFATWACLDKNFRVNDPFKKPSSYASQTPTLSHETCQSSSVPTDKVQEKITPPIGTKYIAICTYKDDVKPRLNRNKVLSDHLDEYVTVEGAKYKDENDKLQTNNSIYVINQEAVNTYGWIERSITWSDVEDKNVLYSKAAAYLYNGQFDKMKLDVKAYDLHMLDVNTDAIDILTLVQVISRPHGLDTMMPVSEMEIPLDVPEECGYVIGNSTEQNLTSVNNSTSEDLKKIIDAKPTISDTLKAAKSAAGNMLIPTGEGYVIIADTNGDGGNDAIFVVNTPNWQKATSGTIITKNGIGGFKTVPENANNPLYNPSLSASPYYSETGWNNIQVTAAMTNDGQIVADMITTGIMKADHMKGGDLELGAWNYTDDITSEVLSPPGRQFVYSPLVKKTNTGEGIEYQSNTYANPAVTAAINEFGITALATPENAGFRQAFITLSSLPNVTYGTDDDEDLTGKIQVGYWQTPVRLSTKDLLVPDKTWRYNSDRHVTAQFGYRKWANGDQSYNRGSEWEYFGTAAYRFGDGDGGNSGGDYNREGHGLYILTGEPMHEPSHYNRVTTGSYAPYYEDSTRPGIYTKAWSGTMKVPSAGTVTETCYYPDKNGEPDTEHPYASKPAGNNYWTVKYEGTKVYTYRFDHGWLVGPPVEALENKTETERTGPGSGS